LQVALTRVFSFTLWYHFAYVVISLALLGYGASGALLSAFPGILRGQLPRTLFLCALGSAIAIPASLAVYAHTPFYPLQLLRSPVQWAYLGAYYAATGIPFFLAGMCIAGAITAASDRVTRVYCADLVGAGLGAGLVVPLIWRLETPGVVILAAGLMAGAAVCWAWWWRPQAAILPVAVIAVLGAGGGRFWRSLEFRPTAGKMMAIMLAPRVNRSATGDAQGQQSGSLCRRLPQYTRWGAVFRVDVLQPLSEATRARSGYYTLGASTLLHAPVPFWLSIPHDGDANATIYGGRDPRRLELFDDHAIALPYVLLGRGARVLVLGAGGGTEIVCGVRHAAKAITAVDLDPLTARLCTKDFDRFGGALNERPGVAYVVGEGRSFTRRSRQTYDLIQINGTDTLTAMSVGASVLNENFLYTVEGCSDYLEHLDKDGLLHLAHWKSFSATDRIKFPTEITRVGSLAQALRRRGVSRPRDHIAVISARGLLTYLARPRPFSRQEVDLLERYCAKHGFVPFHLPYRAIENELSWFLRASPQERAEYIHRSAIRRDAPTDDRPFIWPYFKWRYVFHPEHRYGRVGITSGQLVMLPLLGVALLGALLFILGPLALYRRRGVYSPAAPALALYFGALGFGFMFIEISFIQKFVLFLGYPTYSLTVVLSALLVSSGIGSLASRRLISRAERSLVWALAGLLALGALYLFGGTAVFTAFLGYALWVRVLVAVTMIAPLGFVMGMFFPTGIRVVNQVAPDFIPWAWGINACTSVVAAILAVMLAMSVGFRMVGVCALVIYIMGVAGLYRAHRREPHAVT